MLSIRRSRRRAASTTSRFVVAAMIAAIALAGCSRAPAKIAPPWWEGAAEALPLRQGDFAKYPRENFGFVLERSLGEKIDTFAGVATKDMVIGPDTTIALRLTEAELDTIYNKVIAIRFFDYPMFLWNDPRTQMSPQESLHLEVRVGDVVKDLRWTTGEPVPELVQQRKRLGELVGLIQRMVTSHAEYQALPPARGGYL